jgi:hypothetical protein
MSLTWTYAGTTSPVFSLPIVKTDTIKEVDVSIVSTNNLTNCFLYTLSDYINIITAKRSDQSSYMEIGVRSINPTCFIGNLVEEVSVTLNFRLDFSSFSTYGENFIPIYVGSGENICGNVSLYMDFFFHDEVTDNPDFWESDTDELDSWFWVNGV